MTGVFPAKIVGWKCRCGISRDGPLMLVLHWLDRIFYASCGMQPAPASQRVLCTVLIHVWQHDACATAPACDWLPKLNFWQTYLLTCLQFSCCFPETCAADCQSAHLLDHLFDSCCTIHWHSMCYRAAEQANCVYCSKSNWELTINSFTFC